MKQVSKARPLGAIQSNSVGNCIVGTSPAAISAIFIREGPRTQCGPHSWNGPRAHELDEMNDVDLETRLREAKEELFNLRFQAATGQLESHGRLRTVKKDIARIYTVVRERELGIRTTPDAADVKTQKEGADA